MTQHIYYKNSPLHRLPQGTIALTRFGSVVGIAPTTILRHASQGIDGERIAVTKAWWQERVCHYVTPDQQRNAIEFWERHKVRHRKPVPAGEVEAKL